MPKQASSERAPALLECVAALAASPNLAPVLANRPSTPAVLYCQSTPDWIRTGLGAQLLGQTLRVLSLPTCSPASLDVALRVIESILSLGTHVTDGGPDEDEGAGTRNGEDGVSIGENGTCNGREGMRDGVDGMGNGEDGMHNGKAGVRGGMDRVRNTVSDSEERRAAGGSGVGKLKVGEAPEESLREALLGPHKTALLLCLRDLATGSRGGTLSGAQGEKRSKEAVSAAACYCGGVRVCGSSSSCAYLFLLFNTICHQLWAAITRVPLVSRWVPHLDEILIALWHQLQLS